ncbi:class I SAM-dependent methyltransferase [Gramella sp. KN1008]|uniref:class I SAM-dependent methyltransferase n=1 Tax=Gramella sp. KN1008 TaxID=2529298 RepID=UPI0010387F9B|nr:class I SAM-dependent methyltransferase [Gramella sp. KN1008]TBW25905.1 class I SAM-dependent methyltransferase [Gramella sp. KN1008]
MKEDSKDYLEINKRSWNNRTEVHVNSEFYDMPSFLAGNTSLKEIELELLGDIKNKKVLHLQCHFGQDSISLARMGAKVTGVDLSDKAIETARKLTRETGTDCNFICCDVYNLPNNLDEEFDMVFATYGTIGWLPDINRWASVVSKFLRTGGKLIFVEFHPFVWMFDDYFEKITYRYFNSGPIEEDETGTYADKGADITQDYVMWNHALSEVQGSLINNGMHIESFKEYDYSPYDVFEGGKEIEKGKFRIEKFQDKIPLVYSITATKV